VTRYAVSVATSRTIAWVGEASSKEDALARAVVALDRNKVPLSWSAWTVDELPADLQAAAMAWTAEAQS